MIRLHRGPPPSLLVQKRDQWTARWWQIHRGTGKLDWATDRAKEMLAQALESFGFGKCAYCESRLRVTSYAEIEHYIAKSIDPDRAFEWDNLLPTCRLCNGRKESVDHGGVLLRPDQEDVESMLWLNPDSGKLEPSALTRGRAAARVERTIELCDLQRPDLCDMRVETMNRVQRWLSDVRNRGPLHPEVAMEWVSLTHPRTAYKLVVRHVLHRQNQPELATYDRQRFEEGR